MIGDHKLLGIGLSTLVALAMLQTPALGQDLFTAKQKTAALTGISTELGLFRITSAWTFDCGKVKYSGTVQSGAGEVTVVPTFTGSVSGESSEFCGSSSGGTRMQTNGCDFDFTGKTTQADAGKTDAVAHITCPVNAEITTAAPSCSIKIPGQTPTSGGVTYINEAGGQVKVTATLTGLTYTTQGAFCALLGLPSEGDDLDFLDGVVLKGYEDLGGPINGDEFNEGAQVGIEVS